MLAPTFLRNSEIIRFNATPFFPGDGVTSSATLLDRHGNPISAGKLRRVDSIYRTDWQGRQLLYPTARTNVLLYSSSFDNAYWGKINCTISANTTTAPDGSTTADTLTATSTNQTYCYHASPVVGTSTVSLFVKPGTATSVGLFFGGAGGGVAAFSLVGSGSVTSGTGASITALSGGWYRISLTTTTSTIGNVGYYINPMTAGTTVYLWGVQVETGAFASPYIPTTTAAVTVTDYTLTGPSVAFGQVPVAGSMSDWTGVAKR